MKKISIFITWTLLYCSTINAREYQGYLLPDCFNDAMISVKAHAKSYNKFLEHSPDKEFYDSLKHAYEQFVINLPHSESHNLLIPKIIHQIWIGPHEVPEETKEWQKTWQTLHPDWEYKLWTNHDLDSITLINQKYFDQASNWGEKADILRLELLYEYGGLYVDIDFACIQSFDWLHYACDFYTGIHTVKLLKNHVRIANGLIGAKPHHPILKHAIEQIPFYRTEMHLTQRTGPDFFTTIIKESKAKSQAQKNVDIIFPANFFYPQGVNVEGTFRIQDQTMCLQPETMAAHYYTSYWIRPPGTELPLHQPGHKKRPKVKLPVVQPKKNNEKSARERRVKKQG